jgi:ABC-2 type transport system permease protein
MSRAPVIARREFGSYFRSPIAFVAMALFLVASGIAFLNDFEPGQPAALRSIFDWMIWFLVLIIPILSMGLLAQEWATGTMETLITAPIGETDVVLGKFLGSLGLLVVLLAPTLLYVVMLRIYGHPDIGPIISGYLGIILVGSLFISVGLFCSSLTRSQIVAAVASASILVLVTIVPWYIGSKAALPAFWRAAVDQAVFKRYTDFSKGVLDIGNIVFFLLTTGVFLFITVKVLESRRWK